MVFRAVAVAVALQREGTISPEFDFKFTSFGNFTNFILLKTKLSYRKGLWRRLLFRAYMGILKSYLRTVSGRNTNFFEYVSELRSTRNERNLYFTCLKLHHNQFIGIVQRLSVTYFPWITISYMYLYLYVLPDRSSRSI